MNAQFNDTDTPLSTTLRHIAAHVQGDSITLQELLALAGEQSLLVFSIFLTLPFLLPVSIPGVSTVFGCILILIGIGITFNRLPWLPSRLMQRPLERAHLVSMLENGATTLDHLTRWIKPRLHIMTGGGAMNRLSGLALTAGGIFLLFPLSFIPFSNTLPAVSILLLALGMLQRDGYVVLAGYLVFCITVIYFSLLGLMVAFGGTLLFA